MIDELHHKGIPNNDHAQTIRQMRNHFLSNKADDIKVARKTARRKTRALIKKNFQSLEIASLLVDEIERCIDDHLVARGSKGDWWPFKLHWRNCAKGKCWCKGSDLSSLPKEDPHQRFHLGEG